MDHKNILRIAISGGIGVFVTSLVKLPFWQEMAIYFLVFCLVSLIFFKFEKKGD